MSRLTTNETALSNKGLAMFTCNDTTSGTTITLPSGQTVYVDEADYSSVRMYHWTYVAPGYVLTSMRQANTSITISMHRLLMQPPHGMVVDHIDGNGLNNRRINLRICTRQQNLYNQGSRRNSTSQYKGVSWHATNHRWFVKITVARRPLYVGSFTDETEAARAYNEAARQYYGEFARLNEVDE